MSHRIFTNDDWTVLVQLWEGEGGEVARRPSPSATWGPPEHIKEKYQPGYDDRPPLPVLYRNHRGVVARRLVRPLYVYFGSTEFHPERQWLLEVYDVEKAARRTFALADCNFASPKSASLDPLSGIAPPPPSEVYDVPQDVWDRLEAAGSVRTEPDGARTITETGLRLLRDIAG